MCVYSKSNPTTNRAYGVITAISVAGGNMDFTLSRMELIGAVPNTLANITDWICAPIGLLTAAPGGTLSLTAGGTGATSRDNAALALWLYSPRNRVILSDDFISYGLDYDAGNPIGIQRPGLYCAISGTVNFCAHADSSIMGRFPNVQLARHPGLVQQYVVANGDSSKIAIKDKVLASNGQVVFVGPATYEFLFTFGAYNGVLPTSGWSLKMGFTDDLASPSNEIGVGIRPNGSSPSGGNVFQMYGISGGVTTNATGGFTASIDTYPTLTWWKVQLIRTAASSALTGFLYGYDEDGQQGVVASLGSVPNANLPAVSLRPFSQLDKTVSSNGYVEMLTDFAQLNLGVVR